MLLFNNMMKLKSAYSVYVKELDHVINRYWTPSINQYEIKINLLDLSNGDFIVYFGSLATRPFI